MKPKYKIVDGKGNVYETFRYQQTAISVLEKYRKIYLNPYLKIIKIGDKE